MALLEVESLSTMLTRRDRVVRAVEDVSFAIERGEVVGLVGESGCGKTMAALSVIRLLPQGGRITGGSVRLDGVDLVGLTEPQMCSIRGGSIGMIFQDPLSSLTPTKRIGNQITEAIQIHEDLGGEVAKRRALDMLKLVGLPGAVERFDDYPHQLSGGMRQRVMIAMALACHPKLLIADEPTTALDATVGAQIMALLEKLRDELGMAIILITHDLGVIAGIADRVLVMYAGRIAEAGSVEAVFYDHRHHYTRALLEAIPRLDERREHRLRTIPGSPPDLASPLAGSCRFNPRCPRADDTCRDQEPALSGGVHSWACFHPLEPGGLHVAATGAAATNGAVAAREPGAPLLEVRDLVKTFESGSHLFKLGRPDPVEAVASISFSVAKGETLGLIGESGCGKTTTGRMVIAVEPPTSGSIVFDGAEIRPGRRGSGSWRRELQMIFQDPFSSLDPRMPIVDTIAEPLVVQKIGNRASRVARVNELLDLIGLPRHAAIRYPYEFSGGQRQRIAVARAFALSPKLIVADEPVSALDVSIRAQVINLMMDLQQEFAVSYIVISHDVSAIRHCARRVAVMYLGKLVEIGPVDDVLGSPMHPYTDLLVGAIPVPDPATERSKPRHLAPDEPPAATRVRGGCRFAPRCPRAQAVCTTVEPPLNPSGTRQLACHFPIES
jgi:oligopeptide/dipeptide ABC transporter ATP-binding protein